MQLKTAMLSERQFIDFNNFETRDNNQIDLNYENSQVLLTAKN